MNSLKRVIRKGKKLILLINKYYKNKNKNVWLTQTQLKKMIRTCTNLHLRLPYWDFMIHRNNEYNNWNNKVKLILDGKDHTNTKEKCSYNDLVNLVKQYNEYRIFSKNGDILKSYISPIKKWINTAKSKLILLQNQNDINKNELHELLLNFEIYTTVITSPPTEYQQLLQYLGISPWMQNVYQLLNGNEYIIGNINKINELIQIGNTFKLKQTQQYVNKLSERLNILDKFYKECDEKLQYIINDENTNTNTNTNTQNCDKKYDLNEYKNLIYKANGLKINIKQNDKLMKIQSNIDKIEEWQQYIRNTISKLPSANNDINMINNGYNNNNNNNLKKNKKKRTLSEFQNDNGCGERNKYLDGAYKRRRKNNNVPILSWQRAINEEDNNDNDIIYNENINYKQLRDNRSNEYDIINELKDIIKKSSNIPVKSELENEAKNGLINIEQCVNKCNQFLGNVNNDKNILIGMKEDEIIKIKQNAQTIVNNTLVEFKVSALHWRWHAIRYLMDIKQANKKKKEKEKQQEEKKQESVVKENMKQEVDVEIKPQSEVEKEVQQDVKMNENDKENNNNNVEVVEVIEEVVKDENKEEESGDKVQEEVQEVGQEPVQQQHKEVEKKNDNDNNDNDNEVEMKDNEQVVNEENKPESMETDNVNVDNNDNIEKVENEKNINEVNNEVVNNEDVQKDNMDVDENVETKEEVKQEDIQENVQQNVEPNVEEVVPENVENNAQENAENNANEVVQENVENNTENNANEVVPENVENNVQENVESNANEVVQENVENNLDSNEVKQEENKEEKQEENISENNAINIGNNDITMDNKTEENEMEQDEIIVDIKMQKEEVINMVDMDKHWSLGKLWREGRKLGLNIVDISEWNEICLIFKELNEFERVSIGLLVDGNVDCNILLSVNERCKNISNKNENDLNVINIIKHCIGNNKQNNYLYSCLNKTILQISSISDRILLYLSFYNGNFKTSLLTYDNLEILLKELDLLSGCICKQTIPYFQYIEATHTYMNTIFDKLNFLFSSRPHSNKCELISWINFLFMQFNIMYRNCGQILMDKYRSNNINNCYCFCRFNYTQQMRENNEEIPEMIGCDECGEWYHSECIMLDEKQMKKFLNTKKQKFICPRCCYYEYNDNYKFFPSLHWNSDLVKLSDLEDLLNHNIPENVILCNCDIINSINRLILWIKIWQKDVNNFINKICETHQILSDFTDEEIFIIEYLLNCGQISGIYTSELLILKILMRFIGKSKIWNNHEGIRQLILNEIPIMNIENELLPKYKTKSKLLSDFITSIIIDIKNSKNILYDLYIDLYLIKSIGIHYTTHMRRKKKGPLRVKLILQRLENIIELELKQCENLKNNKIQLEQEGDQYVNAQFEDDNRWLKYVNDSISMKKIDKTHFQEKWIQRLNLYKDNLLNKYKNSRLQIQSIVLTLDLLQKLMEG